ncbi:MAG TPA: TolC family protein [Planctomycetota bacterium]|nr:TolC family protein [Planctomycetota bacterium]
MRRAQRPLGAIIVSVSLLACGHAADPSAERSVPAASSELAALIAAAARLDGAVVAADAARDAAETVDRAGGRWDDPRLALEGGVRTDRGDDAWLGRVDLTQRLPIAGEFGARRHAARSRVARADADAAAARARVAAEVARLATRWSAATARREAARSTLAAAEDAAAAVSARLAAGQAGDADELAARIAAEEAAEDARRAEQAIEAARARLIRRCGLDEQQAPRAPLAIALPPLDRLAVAAAVERHPALRAAAAELAVAQADAGAAQAGRWQDVRAGAFAERDDDETMLGLTVEVPLPVWNRNVAVIAGAQADARGARARHESLRRALAAEAEAAWFAWDAARQRATHHAERLLPAAREGMRLALAAYGAGAAPLAAVLDARRTLARLVAGLVDATEARDLALIDLHAATGGGEALP